MTCLFTENQKTTSEPREWSAVGISRESIGQYWTTAFQSLWLESDLNTCACSYGSRAGAGGEPLLERAVWIWVPEQVPRCFILPSSQSRWGKESQEPASSWRAEWGYPTERQGLVNTEQLLGESSFSGQYTGWETQTSAVLLPVSTCSIVSGADCYLRLPA